MNNQVIKELNEAKTLGDMFAVINAYYETEIIVKPIAKIILINGWKTALNMINIKERDKPKKRPRITVL